MRRLQTRAQFQLALSGPTVARTVHFALHRLALPGASSNEAPVSPAFAPTDVWLGAMVPKRWARRAVTRNAIRRQIYSVSIDPALNWPLAAHVVRLRASFDRREFVSASSDALKQRVRQELQQLFARATAST